MELHFNCPHCQEQIIVYSNEINCGIFRHAVFKSNLQQINPHETKENCDKYVTNNLVYGCAKPFEIIKQNDNYVIQICNYV
jgi:hypothetical protein